MYRRALPITSYKNNTQNTEKIKILHCFIYAYFMLTFSVYMFCLLRNVKSYNVILSTLHVSLLRLILWLAATKYNIILWCIQKRMYNRLTFLDEKRDFKKSDFAAKLLTVVSVIFCRSGVSHFYLLKCFGGIFLQKRKWCTIFSLFKRCFWERVFWVAKFIYFSVLGQPWW